MDAVIRQDISPLNINSPLLIRHEKLNEDYLLSNRDCSSFKVLFCDGSVDHVFNDESKMYVD
jgi:hypothetical protein